MAFGLKSAQEVYHNQMIGGPEAGAPTTKATALEVALKEYGGSLEHLIEHVKRIEGFRERLGGSRPEAPTPVNKNGNMARPNNGAIGSLNIYNEILRTQTTSLAELASHLENIA